jgi:G3E family GTPase
MDYDRESPNPGRITCDVLTGYLGSGKTTLLNRYLRSGAGAGTAVVVNEVGEIGIDQLILQEVSDNVVLLDSGCLCCSLTGTLRETLLELASQARRAGLPLRRIVIETTGLAEPLPILHSLLGDKLLTGGFALGRVVTTVDAQHALAQLAAGRETARQIAVADVLVTTKTDLVEAAALSSLETAVRALNPRARVISAQAHDLLEAAFETPVDRVDGPVAAPLQAPGHAREGSHDDEHDGDHEDGYEGDEKGDYKGGHEVGRRGEPHRHLHHHHEIGAQSFWVDQQTSWPGIAAWWHLLMQRYEHRLLRCKGILQLVDTPAPVLVQGVGNYFYPPTRLARWPEGEPRARVTLIGEGLERDWLQASLRALCIDTGGLLPRTLDELEQVWGEPGDKPQVRA